MSAATGEAPGKRAPRKRKAPGKAQVQAKSSREKQAASATKTKKRQTGNGAASDAADADVAQRGGEDQPDAIEIHGGPPKDAPKAEVIEWLAELPPMDRTKDLLAAAKKRLGLTVADIRAAIKEEIRKHEKAERDRIRAGRVQQGDGFTIFGGNMPPGARPERQPDADGVIWPPGFTMKKSGLWYEAPPRAETDEPTLVWICAPLQVVAQTNDETDHENGLLLQWRSRSGGEHEWPMPQSMVHADGNDIPKKLQDAGLSCGTTPAAHQQLKHFLGAVRSIYSARCVATAGWHNNDYVLPDGRAFGASSPHRLVMQSESIAPVTAYIRRNSLQQWQQNIAIYAVGNDLLAFAISLAFGGTLLRFTGDGSGGFHVKGGSQTGKTTMLAASASVWGPGTSAKGGHICQWRATANGLEAVAAQHNDRSLYLDELSQISGRDCGDVVYMIGNGQGKARLTRTSLAKARLFWRLLWLSSGEITLADKMGETGMRALAGQEARMLTVASDAGAGHGVYSTLHGFRSGASLTNTLRRNAVDNCGTAGAAFLEQLVADCADADRLEALTSGLRIGLDAFVRTNVAEGADGQVVSAARRFALVGVAGELARSYGILPWDEGMASAASANCFQRWRASRGGEGADEDREAIRRLRYFLGLHGSSRYERLDLKPPEEPQARDPDDPYQGSMGGGRSRQPFDQRTYQRAGWVKNDGNNQQFWTLPEVWRQEIFAGMDARRATQAVQKAGFLVAGSGTASRSEYVPGVGDTVRVYVVRSTILAGDEP
jgi:uncharacterized protein (DUF927 family)